MKSALASLLIATLITLFLETSTTRVVSTPRHASDAQTDQALKILAKDKAALELIIARVAALTGAVDDALEEASCKIQSALKKGVSQNSVQQFVTKAFDVSDAALDDAVNAVEWALAKTTEACAQSLTLVLNWLKTLQGNTAGRESAINAALANGTTEDLENNIAKVSAAVERVETELATYIAILEQCPEKIVNRARVVVKKNVELLLAYANANIRALSSLLPGAGESGNTCA